MKKEEKYDKIKEIHSEKEALKEELKTLLDENEKIKLTFVNNKKRSMELIKIIKELESKQSELL